MSYVHNPSVHAEVDVQGLHDRTFRPQTDSTPTRPSPSANASRSSGYSTAADGVAPASSMSSRLLHCKDL